MMKSRMKRLAGRVARMAAITMSTKFSLESLKGRDYSKDLSYIAE
jgi:hypothetical protein